MVTDLTTDQPVSMVDDALKERRDLLLQLRELEQQLEDINRNWRWRRLFGLLHSADALVIESILILCSAWAAFVLFTPPSNFGQFPLTFALTEAIIQPEYGWAWFAAIAAMVKLAGLACYRPPWAGPLLRCTGLAMSGTFWFVMGASTMVGNPDTLFGFCGLMMGFLAWWSLFRVPW
jgi:hypothetical protein